MVPFSLLAPAWFTPAHSNWFALYGVDGADKRLYMSHLGAIGHNVQVSEPADVDGVMMHTIKGHVTIPAAAWIAGPDLKIGLVGVKGQLHPIILMQSTFRVNKAKKAAQTPKLASGNSGKSLLEKGKTLWARVKG